MEALPILTSQRPQIVLSDVKMPRMNGFELCRYIKQKPDLNYMPVILLTSCVDDASIEEGYKTGAEAYITKPFDIHIHIADIFIDNAAELKHQLLIDVIQIFLFGYRDIYGGIVLFHDVVIMHDILYLDRK